MKASRWFTALLWVSAVIAFAAGLFIGPSIHTRMVVPGTPHLYGR
jgi:hypothetical protein